MTGIAQHKSFEQLPRSKTAYLEQISLILVDGACLISVKGAQSGDFSYFAGPRAKLPLK